ncbi:sensor domain-containing protein [Streptomyces boninensis]|uniref:sensor domain-containing protein n=1 Tax=Streptomyces boninensis TaxID=2039455 RepID=UPI003B221E82
MTEMTAAPLMTSRPVPYETAQGDPASSRAGRFGNELGYLLAGLPIGIAAFVVAVTGVAVGAGAIVAVFGLPVLAATLAAARSFARGERARVAAVTGRAIPEPRYLKPEGTGLGRRLLALKDPQAWRDLAHMVVAFPLRVLTFSLALTWTVGAVGELLYVTWSWALPRDRGEEGLLDLAFGISSRAADIGFNTGIGVVLLLTAVPVMRGLTALQAGAARALLANPAQATRH